MHGDMRGHNFSNVGSWRNDDVICDGVASEGVLPTFLDASQPVARTPRRCEHSRNLELDRYVAQNGKILISIVPGQDKRISPHVVHFSNTFGVLTGDTFLVRFLKWADMITEYIELMKSSLQITMEQSSMNRAVRAKQPYNHSSGAKCGQFVSQAATDMHVDDQGYSKGLGWGPKPKSRRTAGSSSSTSVEQELTHARKVNKLKPRLEVVEEESNRKHEESARLIEAQAR
ncbi:(R)-mandelonitrile lyase 1-like [Cucumis melo var. makuwa]|uniref:(R)-mandelonitrile lyase 1-like n=1 Tax=Cucumis melo var. makuwa TaxID=1194695 RepID=A0A5D3CIG3_CUCMM|nr:(R)-mandelonitrile lyase 1-like [Cucumis melo var. makuwa]TYK10964.1 (R)-mandelonitrile lyase 1-like [Cucumis melo var. makuwa]